MEPPMVQGIHIDITDQIAVVGLLSEEISRSSLKLKDIARGSVLCQTTVSRLYYRETRFPRYLTIMKLLSFFKYSMTVQKQETTFPNFKASSLKVVRTAHGTR